MGPFEQKVRDFISGYTRYASPESTIKITPYTIAMDVLADEASKSYTATFIVINCGIVVLLCTGFADTEEQAREHAASIALSSVLESFLENSYEKTLERINKRHAKNTVS